MKQKIILSVIATITLIAVAYLGANTISNSGQEYSDLIIQNIEALTESDSEFVITCSSGSSGGRCFVPTDELRMCGEYMYHPCRYIGSQEFYCAKPPCAYRPLL